MNTINERFKGIRKALGRNQESWGLILGITRPGVSDIESGRRNVTDKHIRLLCIECIDGKYVNEDWLRNGSGDMFLEIPEEDEVANYVSDLLEDGDNPFYVIIKEIMRTYSELDPRSKEVLRDFSAELRRNLETKKEG